MENKMSSDNLLACGYLITIELILIQVTKMGPSRVRGILEEHLRGEYCNGLNWLPTEQDTWAKMTQQSGIIYNDMGSLSASI